MTQKKLDKEIRSLEREIQSIKIVMQNGDDGGFYKRYKQSLEHQILELLLLIEVDDEPV